MKINFVAQQHLEYYPICFYILSLIASFFLHYVHIFFLFYPEIFITHVTNGFRISGWAKKRGRGNAEIDHENVSRLHTASIRHLALATSQSYVMYLERCGYESIKYRTLACCKSCPLSYIWLYSKMVNDRITHTSQ